MHCYVAAVMADRESIEILQSLSHVAREAGAELVRRAAGPRTVELKGAIDLVTDADRAAEAIILERLSSLYPGAAVLAEESGESGQAGGLRFIVDPLDGTTNFASGMPHFCTTIAAEDGAGLLAGVIYDPVRDELYAAARGQGATLNGERLCVTQVAELGSAVLATGFPYDVHEKADEVVRVLDRFLRRARGLRRFGSAALDLAWVAQGRFDGYFERGIKPWDIAAGLLIVREAGGVCLDYAGAQASVHSRDVLAGPAALVEQMKALTAGV